MSNGIYIVLGMAVILVITLIRGAISMHKVEKMQTALKELHEMPLNEWEKKWADFVQEEYGKVDDPHRDEVERDMEFFKQCRNEIKEGGQDDNNHQ